MSLDPLDNIDLSDEQTHEVFLTELDGMIESTEEFVRDDKVTALSDPEHRLQDIAALQRVRELYHQFFNIEEDPDEG